MPLYRPGNRSTGALNRNRAHDRHGIARTGGDRSAGRRPDYEEYERAPIGDPVEGFARSDGTLVLKDEDFCSFLLGAIWEDDTLTFSRLLDRSKKQRKARKAAVQPLNDPAVLQRCSDVLNAFRLELAEDDTLAPWARLGPVVPEALSSLLPADLLTNPLAEPESVGDGSRTSGFGSLFSSPFGLSGGAYFVRVDDRACDSFRAELRGARDPGLEFDAIDGQAYLYDVPPANYFWDIDAPGCDWSVDLVVVDLGPEPTATPTPKALVPKLFGDRWTRQPGNPNSTWLTASQARKALLAAGLEVGTCTEQPKSATSPVFPNRIWAQDPPPGTLLEPGSTVDVWLGAGCDIVTGERLVAD